METILKLLLKEKKKKKDVTLAESVCDCAYSKRGCADWADCGLQHSGELLIQTK